MACKYIYKGTTYTKEEFESFVKEEFVKKSPENKFLSLLEKDSNWVTFFIKSIITDSAKKGYEKVLFPTGDTASKVEGHITLGEFKKRKEDRIKELEERLLELESDNFSNLNVFNFAEVNLEEAKKIITNSFINATQEEAKLIYRKFAIQYHPDRGGSEELMKHLNDVNDKFKNGKLNQEKEDINKQAVRKFYEEVKNNLEKHREGKTILGKTYNSNTFKYKNDIKLTSQDFIGGILSNNGYFKVGNFIRYALQNPHLFEADSLEILRNLTKGQHYNSENNLANTSIRVGNPSDFTSVNSLGAVFVKKSATRGYADISEIHINPAYFDIKFFENNFNNDKFKEFVNTIGHELIHKLTIPDLLSDNTTRKEIEEIYKAAKEAYKNYTGIKNNITDYALSNLSEFTANYFNSKEFKDFLKNVNVKSENNKNKSLLDKLISIIARFFNKNYEITEKNAYEYLTKIINNNTFYGIPNKVFVKKADYSTVNENIQEEKSIIENEINQLKQELERVETEGFGALKPIYNNFYETTITNILKKQGYNPVLITDEYGNTWNKVTIDSKRDLTDIMLQIPGSYNSTQITSELYSTLVEFVKKLNPNFEINVLNDLLENRGVNGVARIKEFIIDLQSGKESALAEEVAHFFVELLPEDHSLKQALYSEIPHTKLYKKVVQDYRTVYGNDIKRLQREAMAKLISLYLTDKEMFNYWSGSPSLVDTLLKWIKTFFQWIKGKSDPFILAANKITGLDTTDLKLENATLADDMFSLAEFMNKTQVLESVGNTYIKPYDKVFINLNDTILDYQGYKGSAKEKRDFLFDERKINERNEFFKTANFTSLGKELEDKIQFIGPDKIVFFTQMPVNEVLIERLAHLGRVERINIPQVIINEETGEVIKEYETNSLQELMEGSEKPLVIDNSVKTLNIPHTFKRFNSRKSSYVNLKTRLDREEQRKQKEEKERDFVGEMKLLEQSDVIQKVKKAFDILKKELGDTKRTEYILEQMGESNSLFRDAYGNITLPLNLAKNASTLVDEANNYEKALIQYLMTIEATTKFFKNLNNSKFQSTRDLIEKGSEEDLEKAIQELYAISKMGTDWQEYIRTFRKLTKDLPHTNTMDSVFGELDTQITRTKALALDLSNRVIGEKLKDQFESYNATINSQIEDFTSRLDKSEGVEKQRLEERITELQNLLKTPEDLFKILIGESKDIDNLTVWIKTLHNSGDPLIGSIGRLMQKAFAEVETSVLQRAQDFGQRVTELKQQFNITDKDIEEQLVTTGTTRVFNSETEEFEVKERLEVLNPFQNLHEYDVKKEEVDKLRLKWKQSESEETKKAYFDTKREFESWLNSNWYQEFTPEYYSRYASLLTTSEEQELFEEVKQDQINIYDQINDIVSTMEVDNILAKKESLKKIQTLRQELKGMKRDVYLDGTPKVGRDLEKAKMLQRKSEIDRETYEYRPNYQKFRTEFTILLNTMDMEEDVYQTLMSLVNKESFSELYQYAKENAPFEMLDWLNDNTVIRFTQEWYDERAQLSEGISQLTNEINELQGVTKLDLKEEWESLMNLSSPLRDEDNILDGSLSTPEIQKKVLSYEQKIEDAKRAAREEAKGVYSIEIKEKKKTLTELIKRLNAIQSKSTTDAYNEQFVTIARESGFLEKFNSKYPGLQIEENSNLNAVINTPEFRSFVENENDEFTKWFKDNHFLKSSIVDGNEVFNWSPTYIWMKIEPTESKNILMVPSMQYSIRQVKPEFKTEKVDWVTWNPINKRWLPKSQTYFNQAYLRLMQSSNEGLKQILKEITEYHLETQSDPYTPREAKIGFGLPSVAKRDLETGEYFKNMFQNFIQKENRFEEGEGNYSEIEGEKKSLKQRFISWFNGVTGKEEPSENSTDNVARYTRIAVPYSHYMEPERVSKDILLTTIMFAGSTAKSQRMLKESKLFRLIEDSLQSTSLQLDQRGRPVDTNKNRYKAFRFYLDHHVYGMNKQYELGKYGKQIDQVLTRVRKLNTIGTLGLPFGFANTLKNNLQGRLQNIIGNQFANWSSPSSMRKASLNLGTNFFKFMSEIERNPKDRSLDYHILTFFNPHHLKQGELILKGGSKKLLQERHIYLFNEGMEFSISANLLYGHLYHKKVKGENGEVKTLYEILEKKDNKLAIKPGFTDYRTGKPVDMDYLMNLKLGYRTVLEYAQGKVDSKTLLSTYTIGQTLLYFKNWMIPMLRRRFDKSRPNYMIGEEVEGYWRTFGKLSYQMLKDFVQHGKLYWNTYTEEEKRNYMTTLNEIVFVIGSSILISLVFGFDADDPDKFKKLKDNSYAENLALLMVLQAKSETETLSMMPFFNVESQIIPPVFTETLRLVKNPTTGFAAAEDLSKMIDATYGLVLGKENAYYKQNIPQFNIEKGDSKLEHYFFKFVQYDNWLYATENPEGRIQSFIAMIKR